MEALALLCTLHADGPSSLRRLRRAGCATVQQLESLPPDDLAHILEVPPAVARRLAREARGLVGRLDLGPFEDREETPELGAPAGFQVAPASGGLGRRDRALLDEVLDRWREDTPRERELPPLVMDPPVEESDPLEDVVLAETVEARPRPEPADSAPADLPGDLHGGLAGGEVDGLDADLAANLRRVGVGDLTALIAADALALAQEVGRPFTQLRRLQFIAQRDAPVCEPVPEPEPVPDFAPAPVPESSARVLHPATDLELPVPRITRITPAQSDVSDEQASIPTPASERKFWEPLPSWAGDLGASNPVEEPIPLPPEAPTPPAEPRPARRPGRTLNWTFELPPKPGHAAPDPVDEPLGGSIECVSAPPAPIEPPTELSTELSTEPPPEGAAGPFA